MVDFHGGDYAEVMAATPVDIMEYANSYVLVIDMPGLQSGDIRAQVKADNVLLISAERRRVEKEGAKYVRMERRVGKFMRKFALPENANTDKITAVCRDGELTVTVEKLRPPEPKRPRTIQEAFGISREDECKVVAVDRISVLPNELLVSILCLLRFKEATATSILSRRWRHLHTFTTELDFDGTYFLRRSKKSGYKNFDEERRKYMRWVEGVVGLHQSSRLEKFRVLFNLNRSHTHHIDEWVRFSLSRKVESLELHLTGEGEGSPEYCDCYTLNLDDFKSVNLMMMKKVSTYNVNVSGEAVEMLLRNCPLLEQVSIAESGDLLGVRIIEPFPSFKRLELVMCENLSSIVVRDSNVVSIKYMGKRVNSVQLVNVPLLTEVWVGGMCTGRAEDVVAMFSSVLPQLHKLKIRFMYKLFVLEKPREFCSKFSSAVEMSSLHQLVVDVGDFYDDRDSLLPLVDLIRASPLLQTFVIQAPHEKYHVDNFSDGESRKNIPIPMVDRTIPMAYHHLKKVEFVGYRGLSCQFDMIMHLVENGAALETIVVDPWGFKTHWEASWDQIPRRKFNKQVFARANQLKDCVPFGINVKIL